MNALNRAEIQDKLYRLWFMLNQRVKIRVVTGIGVTEYKEQGELI